jgi:hypothetical protein
MPNFVRTGVTLDGILEAPLNNDRAFRFIQNPRGLESIQLVDCRQPFTGLVVEPEHVCSNRRVEHDPQWRLPCWEEYAPLMPDFVLKPAGFTFDLRKGRHGLLRPAS